MNVKDKKKFAKLVKIALSDNDRISERIEIKDLVRLTDGELSHVGSALINGCEVVQGVGGVPACIYNGDASFYKIKTGTITVFGVEVEPFTGEDLAKVKKCSLYGYGIVFNIDAGMYITVLYNYPPTRACNKTVFKREIDGKAVADAMNRLGGFCEE